MKIHKNMQRFTVKIFSHLIALCLVAARLPSPLEHPLVLIPHHFMLLRENANIYSHFSPLVLHKICPLYALGCHINHLITAVDVLELFPAGTEGYLILFHSCMVFHYIVIYFMVPYWWTLSCFLYFTITTML